MRVLKRRGDKGEMLEITTVDVFVWAAIVDHFKEAIENDKQYYVTFEGVEQPEALTHALETAREVIMHGIVNGAVPFQIKQV